MISQRGRIRLIAKVLARLVDQSMKTKRFRYSGDPTTDAYLREEPFGLLVGVIADQMIIAERAWALPFILYHRLGHLNPKRIARMTERHLEAVMRRPPTLHRFPRTMARWIIQAARRVCREYGGKAEFIWLTTSSATEIDQRLREFSGISQKKAAMFTKILVRDEHVSPRDLFGIDLAYDVHIRRVLLRAGIAGTDTIESITGAGRLLHQAYPALFDDAIWLVGRKFCHPLNPDHDGCPLRGACSQLNRNATTS